MLVTGDANTRGFLPVDHFQQANGDEKETERIHGDSEIGADEELTVGESGRDGSAVL